MILFSVFQFLGSRSCGRTATSAIGAPNVDLRIRSAIYPEISGFTLPNFLPFFTGFDFIMCFLRFELQDLGVPSVLPLTAIARPNHDLFRAMLSL
jgi:hypothetical protein